MIRHATKVAVYRKTLAALSRVVAATCVAVLLVLGCTSHRNDAKTADDPHQNPSQEATKTAADNPSQSLPSEYAAPPLPLPIHEKDLRDIDLTGLWKFSKQEGGPGYYYALRHQKNMVLGAPIGIDFDVISSLALGLLLTGHKPSKVWKPCIYFQLHMNGPTLEGELGYVELGSGCPVRRENRT
jgi:hypothetical protein